MSVSSVYVCVCVADKPRFGREHVRGRARDVHIWAGKTHNVTCHVHAYPEPEIEWWRDDRRLSNNQTFHIFVTSTHSNLQVRLAHVSWATSRLLVAVMVGSRSA